jgi:DNA replication and repair protein RecF
LIIKQLRLTNFKNYPTADLQFDDKINCFIGLNGIGKTNLLDAIHYLSLCKSHINAMDSELICKGTDFFRIEGVFEENESFKIVCKLPKGVRKVFEKDNNAYKKLSDHIGLIPLVMISPEDVRLAHEGSDERRKFLDNTICQYNPQYLQHLVTYNKVLTQRNAILKRYVDTKQIDQNLLEVYNEQMLGPSHFIYEERKKLIEALQPVFNSMYNRIADFKENTSFEYQSQLHLIGLKDLLIESYAKDLILGRTTCGIHKDDFIFNINENALKRFASQGQLKTFVIALKFAQFELLYQYKSVKPIILLDDIFDKLDEIRLKNLLDLLTQLDFGQIFITDTGKSRMKELLEQIKVSFQIFDIKYHDNIEIQKSNN